MLKRNIYKYDYCNIFNSEKIKMTQPSINVLLINHDTSIHWNAKKPLKINEVDLHVMAWGE